MLPVYKPRLTKPLGNPFPRLKRNAPETSNLVGSWIFNEPAGIRCYDLTRGPRQDMTINPDVTTSRLYRGIAGGDKALVITSGGTGFCQVSAAANSPAYLADKDFFTVIWRGQLTNITGFRCVYETGRWNASAGMGAIFNNSGNCEIWRNGQQASFSGMFILNEIHTYAVCKAPGAGYFFRDGVLLGSTPGWTANYSYNPSFPEITIGTDASGNYLHEGFISHMYVCDHHLPLDVIRGIMHNMQSVLAPEQIYVDVPTEAPGQTVDLDFTASVLAGADSDLEVSRPLSPLARATAGAGAQLDITRELAATAAAQAGAAAALEVTRQTIIDAAALAGVTVELITIGTNPVVFDFTASAVAGAATALEIQRALDITSGNRAGADSRIDLDRGLAIDADTLAGVTVLADVQRALAFQSDALAAVEFEFIVAAGGVVTLSFTADAVTTATALLEITRALEPRADILADAAMKTDLELGLTFQADAQAGAAAQLELERQIAVQADVLADASVILGMALDSAMYTNPVAPRDRTNPIAGRNRTNKVER